MFKNDFTLVSIEGHPIGFIQTLMLQTSVVENLWYAHFEQVVPPKNPKHKPTIQTHRFKVLDYRIEYQAGNYPPIFGIDLLAEKGKDLPYGYVWQGEEIVQDLAALAHAKTVNED